MRQGRCVCRRVLHGFHRVVDLSRMSLLDGEHSCGWSPTQSYNDNVCTAIAAYQWYAAHHWLLQSCIKITLGSPFLNKPAYQRYWRGCCVASRMLCCLCVLPLTKMFRQRYVSKQDKDTVLIKSMPSYSASMSPKSRCRIESVIIILHRLRLVKAATNNVSRACLYCLLRADVVTLLSQHSGGWQKIKEQFIL